jgi:hypothetical protein
MRKLQDMTRESFDVVQLLQHIAVEMDNLRQDIEDLRKQLGPEGAPKGKPKKEAPKAES